MSISTQRIEQLLYENEGSTLDFKRDQYPFVGADDKTRSELLKDILAFANSWRRTDALILIGIDEVPGSRAAVLGVNHHLNDADLQQFVNSKTQRPIEFSYEAISFEGKQVGVIIIPLQPRPLYLKMNFGKLQKDVVYIRRGSSTAVAAPDEIANMRQDEVSSPCIDLQFRDPQSGQMLGEEIRVGTTNLEITDAGETPEYGFSPIGGTQFSILSPCANRNYYRELIEFCRNISFFTPVFVGARNLGSVTAQDVRVEIDVPDQNRSLGFANRSDLPSAPSNDRLFPRHFITPCVRGYETTVTKLSALWRIELRLGKIQPQHAVWNQDALYIKSNQSCTLKLEALVYADNLPEPIKRPLVLRIDVADVRMSYEEILTALEDERPQSGKQSSILLQRIRDEFLA